MLELINQTPALLLLFTLLPAVIIGAIVYYFLTNKWQNQYNELQKFYDQSQLDAKNLRADLLAANDKLAKAQTLNKELETKVIALENEIEEEVRDKNEQLSKLEVRLDDLEKQLSMEKLKNIPHNLSERNKEKPELTSTSSTEEFTESKPTMEVIKDKVTSFFKRITKPADDITDAEIDPKNPE